jgi:hypothetical protein
MAESFRILARRKDIDELEDQRRRDYNKNQPSTDFPYEKETQKMFEKDNSHKRIEDRREHDKQMLTLALQWNCLEVAKELIIRGSIEDMSVSIFILDKYIN